ncbi:MAG TPA: LytTR family DNA-binding domain-containing protein [Puia sp.]|nr:LytTR family DNA-binding domain-containing protein [Puia sp.]
MIKLRCILADDEPVARRLLQEYIGDIDFLELKGSVENALKVNSLLKSEPVDLLFLDINMPKLSGIEFLRTATSLPMVIMTTAYAEYARDGFDLDVLDYLVKPFAFERFLKACNKAKDYYDLQQSREAGPGEPAGAQPREGAAQGLVSGRSGANYFFVKCNGKIEKVFYDDLIHIEAMLNYVVLHTTEAKMIVYHTIKGILEQLPADIFLKVHKSSIINVTKVRSIEGNEIDLGRTKVIISNNAYDNALKVILQDRMIKR